MKRQISILCFLIIFLMLFASCNSVEEPSVQPSETSASETGDVKPTEKNDQTGTKETQNAPTYEWHEEQYIVNNRQLMVVNGGSFSINTYDEYRDFWDGIDYPDHFIRYEDLEGIGDLEKFSFSGGGWGYSSIYKEYYFWLNDGSGCRILMSVVHTNIVPAERVMGQTYDYQETTKVNKKDMRKLTTETERYFEISGIKYIYDEKGELRRIIWKKGDVQFSLYNGVTLVDYPYNLDTVVGKLLNIEDNDPAEVVASITKNIKAE